MNSSGIQDGVVCAFKEDVQVKKMCMSKITTCLMKCNIELEVWCLLISSNFIPESAKEMCGRVFVSECWSIRKLIKTGISY